MKNKIKEEVMKAIDVAFIENKSLITTLTNVIAKFDTYQIKAFNRYIQIVKSNEKSKSLSTAIEEIEKLKNPYPKDVFGWDNKEKLNFNRGRFNRHCFEVVENTRADVLKELRYLQSSNQQKEKTE